jgi:hypothetical protein
VTVGRPPISWPSGLSGDYAFLVGIWAVTGFGYFWHGWVIAGWGMQWLLGAWNVCRARPITEDELRGRP